MKNSIVEIIHNYFDNKSYEELRANYKEQQQKILSLEKARENKLNLFD